MDSVRTRLYSKPADHNRPELRGVGRRSLIDTAKAAIPMFDLADLLCGPGKMRRVGQERQKPVLDGIEAALIHTARRRLYRRCFKPVIAATVDPEDWAHDEQLLWGATLPLAEPLVGEMMGRAR